MRSNNEKTPAPKLEAEELSTESLNPLEQLNEKSRPKWPIYFVTGLVTIALVFYLLLPHILLAGQNQAPESLADKSQISRNLMPALRLDGQDPEVLRQMQKLQLIYDTLKNDYYRELSDAEMIEAMYAGLMQKMDSPYTFYLSAEEYSEMEDSMAGEYYGIGAQVSKQGEIYVISDVFDDSPAAKAGLRNGDQFISVDGKSVDDFTDVSTLASAVRGKEGSKVELEIYRSTTNEILTFDVTRSKVSNVNIKYETLEDNIAYVRILEFNQGVAKNFISALKKLQKLGVDTIIFDLRNNGGGYVSEVTEMLDYLLPEGTLATAKGRYGGEEFEESWMSSKKAGVPENWRYTILINEFSASASELFTGCLRDWGKAKLVGKTSFGKGVGSITQELTDGSAIQITNFHYYLPKGDCVQGEGLTPDYEVDLPQKLYGLPLGQIPHEEDTQLQKALEIAKELDDRE